MERMEDKFRGGEIWVTREGAPVMDTVRAMAEHNIGAVPVLALHSNRLIGMFSERDVLRRIVAKGLDPANLRIDEVMTRTPITAGDGDTLVACMEKMQEARCRHLPILREGQLVGMVSLRDAMTEQAHKEAGVFDEIEAFHWNLSDITGGRYLNWKCTKCDKVQQEPSPPSVCGCGARRNEFQLLREA